MNVVDSSAWISYFGHTDGADVFAPAIEDTRRLLVPAICLLEVFKVIYRAGGEAMAQTALAGMQLGSVVPLDATLAEQAARLGLAHRLPLADSVVYATAVAHGADLWTRDADFAGLPGVHLL